MSAADSELESFQDLVASAAPTEVALEQCDPINPGPDPEPFDIANEAGHVLRRTDPAQRQVGVERALFWIESRLPTCFLDSTREYLQCNGPIGDSGPEHRGLRRLRESTEVCERHVEGGPEIRSGECHQQPITSDLVHVTEKPERHMPVRRGRHLARQSTLDRIGQSRSQRVPCVGSEVNADEQATYRSHHSPTMASRTRCSAAVAA